MRSRPLLIALGVVATATFASPTRSSSQCTGLAELWGNDQVVTLVESDTEIGLGLSFYAHGPVAYALWNESGTVPIAHTAGDFKWAFHAGTLLHEMGHNLGLCHFGPVTTSDNQEVLFVTSDNGRLYKLDAQTGSATASVDVRRPTCSEDQLIATPAVQLYSFSNAAFQSAMMSARGRPDDLVFVVTSHGCGDLTGNQVIAYYASDLTERWRFNSTGSYSMGDAKDGCEVDYASNLLCCGTSQGLPGQHTLWAISTLPGGLLWSQNSGGSVKNRPILHTGELYVATTDGTIQKRNPSDGSLIWTLPGSPIVRNIWPEFRSPLPTRLYYTTEDGLLHGTLDNFPSPVPLWPPISPGTGLKYVSAPVVAPGLGKLYVGRNDGYLQQVSLGGALEDAKLAGTPGTLWDPSLDVSSPGAPEIDRLMISTTEGSVKRYCIPWGTTTAVSDSRPVAESFLGQNAPNPFSARTRIEYRLPYEARVEVDIYDVDGHRVRALVRDRQPAGAHQAEWSGLDDGGRLVASGTYFYRLRAEGSRGRSFERSKKIQVVR